ncbi:MAG: glycoside hydrolase family 3 N-terminal domain-containing protein [bacterium]
MPADDELRRQALGSLLLSFRGRSVPSWLTAALADGLGGVVLFGSNFGPSADPRELTDVLRAAAGRDVVVAVDEEGGDVTRLPGEMATGGALAPASPGAAALGHLDDVDTTRAVLATIGWRLVDAGVTVDLAPVADVNLDPANPVIGLRSFGAEPARVARHVAAAIDGVQATGVAACAKHFPGHGATRTDSHHEVATLDRSRAELDAAELVPFRAAVAAGTRAVMTAHLAVPALDPAALATVSPAITTTLLREELGFTGTVVTDALEMSALAGTVSIVPGFVAAMGAGADAIETGALEYPHLVHEIPAAVVAAVPAGRLDARRVANAAQRTAALARSAARPGGSGRYADPALVASAAARSLEVSGPLPTLHRPLVVECRTPNGMATGDRPWSLAARLTQLVEDAEMLTVSGPLHPSAVPAAAAGRSLVLVVRDPLRHPWQQPLLELAAGHPAVVVVDVGWPAELPATVAWLRTRGIDDGLLDAAARRLAERVPAAESSARSTRG